MSHNVIADIGNAFKRDDVPAFRAGDTVKVTVTVSADESALPHDVKKYL